MTLTLTLTGKFYKILRELHADMHPAGGQMLCDLRRGDVVRPGTDQKKPRLRITQPGPCLGTSKTVSRVLYLTVIYLDAPLPVRSSHLPEAAGPAMCFHHGVAPDRVYIDGQSPAVGCALTAPFHPYRQSKALTAVSLCCTFPEVAFGGRYPLSLPCGARTFLTTGLSAWPRDCLSYSPVYFSGIRRDCQRLAAMRPPHRRKSPGPSAENTGWPAERS